MGLVLGLLGGLLLALLRDPVAWGIIAVSLAAGALLRPVWWSLILAAAAFAIVYARAALQSASGNIDLAGLAAIGAAVLALIAFAIGRLARLARARLR